MFMKKTAKSVKKARGGVTNSNLKAFGRNMARAKTQSGTAKVPPKFNKGGVMRGVGAATKGTKISAKMG